jgi:serine-type D-Ala-D-Ala carboxypeptidase/endopeptidase (penicillin-binding protein 4)
MFPTARAAARTGPLLLVALAAGACAHATAPLAVQPPAFDFASMADSMIATAPLDRGHLGILVYDPATGRTLYQHNGERRFVPASNQKLWVTATALHELGGDYRYRTPVLGIGVDTTTGTAQALVVVGSGDPTLSARFHGTDHAALEWLADSVIAAGIRHVAGELIVDASLFDRAIIPGTWTFGNLSGTSAPPTGAFVVAEGLYRIRISPGPAAGTAADIAPAVPAGLEPVLQRVATAAAGARGGTSLSRGPWSDTLRITGSVALDADVQNLRVPMTDPVRFAAHVFADALRARGIAIDGGIRVVQDAAEAAAIRAGRIAVPAPSTPTAPTAPHALPVRELGAWTSPPMSEIVTAILGPSQNWIAEQVVRTLGAERRGEGSWRAGHAVQTSFLVGTVGIDSAALRLNDGSGMSHQNLVTPRAVVQLLDHARTAPWGPTFRMALAKPAEPGTLSNRLRAFAGRLEAKTGTLSNVNALSGYIRTHDGRELIFSVLSNASGLPAAPVVSAIDQLVAALADGRVPR